MRHVLSTALVACIVGALAGATVSTVAQSPAEPPLGTTALDADTVDRLSAVKATNKKKVRANKLVATDAKGFLPSNIVKPKWGLISGKPAAFADGLVGWNEVIGIPSGFADGVDDVGVSKVRVQQFDSAPVNVAAGSDTVGFFLACPAGSIVVGGGFGTELRVTQSRPDGPSDPGDPYGWEVIVERDPVDAKEFTIRVTCLSTTPPGALQAENIQGVSLAKLSPAQLKKRNKRG